MNHIRSIYRKHAALGIEDAAFPTGKVAQSLASVGSSAHEAWLQAKRESKAAYWGYAPESTTASFD